MGRALTELRGDLVAQAEQQVKQNAKESAADWNVQKLLDKKTKDLQEKIEDLEAALERVRVFLGTVAHSVVIVSRTYSRKNFAAPTLYTDVFVFLSVWPCSLCKTRRQGLTSFYSKVSKPKATSIPNLTCHTRLHELNIVYMYS